MTPPTTQERGSPFLGRLRFPEPFTMVLFGATGDLAARKILPALFGLWQEGLLPERWVVIGIGRREQSDEVFREHVSKALHEFRKDLPEKGVADFLSHVHFNRGDIGNAQDFQSLGKRMEDLARQKELAANRLFYLAVDPEYFRPAIENLASAGLTKSSDQTWARVVIEKPFGADQESARALDEFTRGYLAADQIYRIDHYLGKDTVQNLLAFRFGNAIFEPLFHRSQVDHVQITVAETVGMEGKRGSFYDHAGALRDVVQNHLLQLLALIAMEPPTTLKSRDVKDAKLQVLRNLVPIREGNLASRAVLAQYTAGTLEGKKVRGYREEEGVAANSTTETFVALRTEIDSWRWAGVPFLLRTGKRLPHRVTEIAVFFKLPPLKLFRTVECAGDFCDLTATRPNVLLFRIQPDEGITLHFSAKKPGMTIDIQPVQLAFDYSHAFGKALPEAYERLLFDSLRGDPTLFMRSDELDAAWEFVTPILKAEQKAGSAAIRTYAAGTWGPPEVNALAEGCEGGWRVP